MKWTSFVWFASATPAAITLTADRTVVPSGGTWVHVKYANIPVSLVEGAFTAVYSPADADVGVSNLSIVRQPATNASPVKWRYLNDSDVIGCNSGHVCHGPDFTVPGEGQQNGPLYSGTDRYWFNLPHMRFDIRIYLFTNGTRYPVPQASTYLRFDKPTAPIHGHLGLTTKPLQPWRLVWNSLNKYNENGNAGLRWGLNAGNYTHFELLEQQWTFVKSNFCGSFAVTQGYREAGWYHSAVFNFSSSFGSSAAQHATVFYIFGSDADGWSEEHTAKLPPLPSPTEQQIQSGHEDTELSSLSALSVRRRLLLIADVGFGDVDGSRGGGWSCSHNRSVHVGDYPGARAVVTRVTARHRALQAANVHTATLHLGDISYSEGFDVTWALFMNMIEPAATMAPYMVVQGNHERDWGNSGSYFDGGDSWGECGVAVAQRFPLPSGERSTTHDYYSFVYGEIKMVMVNSELSLLAGSPQLEWLEKELASVNRTETPFLVVGAHRPVYSVYRGPLADFLEPLLLTAGADLVLAGHVHDACVTCPVKNGACLAGAEGPRGITYITLGNGGIKIDDPPGPAPGQLPTWVDWYDNSEYGHVELEANATHLTAEMWLVNETRPVHTVSLPCAGCQR